MSKFQMFGTQSSITYKANGNECTVSNVCLVQFDSGDATLHLTVRYDDTVEYYNVARTSNSEVEIAHTTHKSDKYHEADYKELGVTNAAALSKEYAWFKCLASSVLPMLANW